MMYQTLHTPPITPEELCRLETIFDVTEVVKHTPLLCMRLSVYLINVLLHLSSSTFLVEQTVSFLNLLNGLERNVVVR